ncbi:helix-turn-helix domain-containing protein [Burkholderia cenocepacia]|uniref:helix-turn-helix domain-containing protein n=1 Tax=Burkholderia cenocepacia TaxID=95486 RepID=UPI00264E0448|nr:helix-turn-helix transcriptional regulator [Burkholderia cenocepacia]MDN7549484.1 helix-turn-helix transcriptional regulator [Burkholderia cenocepacia]MDN7631689.1 helix-turn-helix transcriptional regulator [Burkholderia cenocepacia]MDS0848578.1 helix-turn-helix domain-containing protein [Burkholderia cenocepacia]
MTALGKFVRKRRKELDLTQVALALRMGVDDAYVSAVETGRRTPDGTSFLDALSRALELDEDGLRQLADASRRSQRYLRLPEELSVRKHELISALVEDVKLSEMDVEAIASVHSAIARNRNMTAAEATSPVEGEAM